VTTFRQATRKDPVFSLRMPPRLKARLQAAAKRSGRSINSELLHRIALSLGEVSSNA
jgi:predicted HicB family RNase H-like nuclease